MLVVKLLVLLAAAALAQASGSVADPVIHSEAERVRRESAPSPRLLSDDEVRRYVYDNRQAPATIAKYMNDMGVDFARVQRVLRIKDADLNNYVRTTNDPALVRGCVCVCVAR